MNNNARAPTNSNRHGAMVAWVESELEANENNREQLDDVIKALNQLQDGGWRSEKITEGLLFAALKLIKPSVDDGVVNGLAGVVSCFIKGFCMLQKVCNTGFYENSRLPKALLEQYELFDYIEAAEGSRNHALSLLSFLELQQQVTSSKFPNVYVCIIASAGTGKTQLAATASLTYDAATTIYLNMGRGESQRFYGPHISYGSRKLKQEISVFLEKCLNYESGEQTTANEIATWAGPNGPDDGTSPFVRMLYHLLTGETFPGEPLSSRMALSTVKKIVQGKKYLVFLDEVPPKGDPEFHIVLCLRDTLRYLGIAPILMSTHTGAQDYVGTTSRKSVDVWAWVLSSLPRYTPFPLKPPAFLVESERPLVLAFAQKECSEGRKLPQIITGIQKMLQQRKPEAWFSSSALQLVQLFGTDVDINGESFAEAHNLIGHHFGCLLQGDEEGRESYNCFEAENFGRSLSVAPVCAAMEPLLYLALVTWNEEMLTERPEITFPLIDNRKRALTVREAFNRCSNDFTSKASTENQKAEKADGNLLEVLVHASLTLASMKTSRNNENYLAGMHLKEFLPLVRRLMLDGHLAELPSTPQLFEDLSFEWPVVPALGGTNSGLPKELAKETGSNLGYLERPEDSAMVDGKISYVCSDENCAEETGNTPFISVECKNYSTGVDASILKEVFKRIKGSIKCSLVFVSSIRPGTFKRSNLASLKKDCFSQHHKTDAVSVVVWNTDKDPVFLKVGEECFVAEKETSLLVVIIAVGTVDACISRKKKRKLPHCANR